MARAGEASGKTRTQRFQGLEGDPTQREGTMSVHLRGRLHEDGPATRRVARRIEAPSAVRQRRVGAAPVPSAPALERGRDPLLQALLSICGITSRQSCFFSVWSSNFNPTIRLLLGPRLTPPQNPPQCRSFRQSCFSVVLVLSKAQCPKFSARLKCPSALLLVRAIP